MDIDIPALLGNIPQKTFTDRRVVPALSAFVPPKDLGVRDALHRVLRLVSVGSKRFLTSKVDRAVTGLIAQQQCCGPLQLTVGDVAVVAQSHFGFTGIATAIGGVRATKQNEAMVWVLKVGGESSPPLRLAASTSSNAGQNSVTLNVQDLGF